MDTVLASLVAVVGTLIGSLSTYLFQRRTAERAEAISRDERLRQERLAAYSEYASAVTELKRGAITLWFRGRESPRDEDAFRAARLERDRLGARAETARFKLQLVSEDVELQRLAEAAFAATGEVFKAVDRREVVRMEREFEAAVGAFIAAAAGQVR
ncbi:hypothetical protein [Kitasatospora sp. McL0602]|uniref:hypothetical protein n=1 Tax=Kitasatospora sp. McL0602 TaxID=3439530 RepID=UPI003F89176B